MDTNQSIEKLVDYHVAHDGSEYYLVKWKQTWERADSLRSFNSLINQFWEFVKEKDKTNVYNNGILLPKEPPVLSELHTNQQPVNNNVNNTLNKTTPKKRNTSSAKTPNTSKTPTKQQKMNKTQLQLPKQQQLGHQGHLGSPQQQQLYKQQQLQQVQPQQIKVEPVTNYNSCLQTTPSQSMVIIDSDDEDMTTQTNKNNAPTNNHQNQNLNQFPPNHNMHPNMNMVNVKTEPTENNISTSNLQQNPYSFNPQMNNNFINSGIHPAGALKTAGRGSTVSPLKRKVGALSTEDDKFNNKQPFVKRENNVKPEPSSCPSPALSWEENCEIINTQTVAGVSLDTQYKCKACNVNIAQKTNFARHFKIHLQKTQK